MCLFDKVSLKEEEEEIGVGQEGEVASEMTHSLKALTTTSDLHSIPGFHMVERNSYNFSSDIRSPDTHTDYM